MADIIYPLGTQDFQVLRENGMVYVDKTALIYNLVNRYRMVFLSRPRRFGKSLLLSTIKAFFDGRKELFEGLEIKSLVKEWETYPVLYLSLTSTKNTIESIESSLREQFQVWEKQYNIKNSGLELPQRFSTIIREAHNLTGKRVVILIDEYDHSLINTINLPENHQNIRILLKALYSNLKDMDSHIRFAMLTGVSRFSKTTIFSGLNNLYDISFSSKFAEICGFTETEIAKYLWEGVKEMGSHNNMTPEQAMQNLKLNYDGYHFTKNCSDIYNPYSLVNALNENEIKPYWMTSGGPQFLYERLKNSSIEFVKIFNSIASEKSLAEMDTAFSSPIALLFQTGYLTIKGFDDKRNRYLLGIPNKEIYDNLFPYLLSQFTHSDQDQTEEIIYEIKKALQDGNPEHFIKLLESYLAGIPTFASSNKISESYFEHTLYCIFNSMGLKVEAEKRIANGRIDLLIDTDKFIYILELKLDKSSDDAIKQIDEKGYSKPWKVKDKYIYKIGINLSSSTKNIISYKIEKE